MKKIIVVIYMFLAFGAIADDYVNEIQYIEQNNMGMRYYQPDLQKENIRIFWKDEEGNPYITLDNLLQTRDLLFAMNGGIYSDDARPGGLYIEDYELIKDINLNSGKDNFHAKPNGVFYMKNGEPYIVTSENFTYDSEIYMAVQSGPVLIHNRKINSRYSPKGSSLNIRNGVCINKEGGVFFIQSLEESNMYDFAKAAQDAFDCENFLYLDGFLSHMQARYGENKGEQIRPFVSIIATEEKKDETQKNKP